ncbi:uncharacterized protein G2W53_014136 [Senna tora]|uniref:Uncharacterized protein n=1 Tax=Senna tora TaxID=362788 RepID=A0A834WSX5_9FABA|nr:uncharacterized protein G2W53_014136 [Senna tora]
MLYSIDTNSNNLVGKKFITVHSKPNVGISSTCSLCIPREPPDRGARYRASRSRSGKLEVRDGISKGNGRTTTGNGGAAGAASNPTSVEEASASGMEFEEPNGARA